MSDMRATLLPIFLEEADENLAVLRSSLDALEAGTEPVEMIFERGFRAAHTIKGTAALVRLEAAGTLALSLENTLEVLARDGRAGGAPDRNQLMILQEAVAGLGQLVEAARIDTGDKAEDADLVVPLMQKLKTLKLAGGVGTDAGQPKRPDKAPPRPAATIQANPPRPAAPDALSAPEPASGKPSPAAEPASTEPERRAALASREAYQLFEEMGLPNLDPATGGDLRHPQFACCRFSIAGRDFHLPMADMLEICELPELTPLPLAPRFVAGLVNLRGSVLPVINLARLDDRAYRPRGETRLVVAQVQGERIGFLAEGMPNLSDQVAGEKIDTLSFVQRYQIRH